MVGIIPTLQIKEIFLKKKNNGLFSDNFQIKYYDSARSALYVYLKNLKIKVGSKILIPSFICDSILQTINELNLEIEFYELDHNLLPNLNQINDDTKVIILVNYFGIKEEKKMLSSLKIPNKTKIVMDSAHSMPLNEVANLKCDAIIYSLYKSLPLPEGGALLTKDRIVDRNIIVKNSTDVLTKTIKKIINLIDSFLPFSIITILLSNDKIFNKVYEKNVIKFSPPRKISNVSKWYLNNFNLQKEKHRRCRNYEILYKLISSYNFNWVEKIYPLSVNSSPLFFPILVKNHEICNQVIRKLRSKSISPGIFWPAPKVMKIKNILYDRLVVLPLHSENVVNKLIKNIDILDI